MTIIEFLQNLARIFYVLITVLTVADYLRHRDRIRRDIALAFGSLTASTVIGQAVALLTLQSPAATWLGGLAFLALPWLLVRLLHSVYPLPRAIERFALAGFLVSCLLYLIDNLPLISLNVLIVGAYFLLIGSYVVTMYIRAFSEVKEGIARLRLAASSSIVVAILLLFAGLGAFFPALAAGIAPSVEALGPVLSGIGGAAVVAQPYLLLRLVRYFRPLPPLVEQASITGMIISWLVFLYGSSLPILTLTIAAYLLLRLVRYFRPLPVVVERLTVIVLILFGLAFRTGSPALSPAGTLVIVAYFVVVNGYSVYAFLKGALSSVGVTRQRLTFAAVGSVMLALLFFVAGLRILFPVIAQDSMPLIQGMSVLTGLAFYLSFATPRWLRQSWQLGEMRNYLLASRTYTDSYSPTSLVSHLQAAVARAVGTDKVVITLNDPDGEALVVDTGGLDLDAEYFNISMDGIIKRVWNQGVPLAAYRSWGKDDHDNRLMQAAEAETLFVVPIATPESRLGLLLVFMEHGSLFPEDDLNLLTIFAQHTAIMLENDAVQEQLRRYSENLERQVQQRTAALQRSNEELGRFAYVASHDLREPLRTVTSYLQLLKERYGNRLDSDADEFITYAVEGSLRMKDLIDGLLAYSRVETQHQKFTMIDVQKVVDDIRRLMKVAIDESGAVITADTLPQIRGDERLITQLFQNLISNGIKYQDGRLPEIHISAARSSDMWEFAVRDNGIGIEPQYLERIFVIFQRLHNRSRYPGAGIGLAICRKVVEHHGGQIRAESEKGKGSTFYFTLPGLEYAPHQGKSSLIDIDEFGTTTSTGY